MWRMLLALHVVVNVVLVAILCHNCWRCNRFLEVYWRSLLTTCSWRQPRHAVSAYLLFSHSNSTYRVSSENQNALNHCSQLYSLIHTCACTVYSWNIDTCMCTFLQWVLCGDVYAYEQKPQVVLHFDFDFDSHWKFHSNLIFQPMYSIIVNYSCSTLLVQ